jgi:uncharacterized protein YjbI with pentapeptide repeats
MANKEHLGILKQGVEAWNRWRKENPKILSDLTRAKLTKADLYGANLSGTLLTKANLFGADLSRTLLTQANLFGANLTQANLFEANLTEANLTKADLYGVNLTEADLRVADLYGAKLGFADLRGADLRGANLWFADLRVADLRVADLRVAKLNRANLCFADLRGADLSEVELSGADLRNAILVHTNLTKANLSGCSIHGISAWDLELSEAKQSDLVITASGDSIITVDNLEVAQFIYLLLNNEKIRHLIDTITSKVVLILGRFTPERKAILDAIREELRKLDYLPVLVDFEKPTKHTFIETVSTLAHMARFVIADFTDPKIVLQEVPHIVRSIAVPVKPLLLEGSVEEPVTLYDLRKNHRSLLDTYRYKDLDDLLTNLSDKVIADAEATAQEFENS